MDIPKTYVVLDKDPLKNITNKLRIEPKEFIDMVLREKDVIVFSCEVMLNVYNLFIVKEGFCIYTDSKIYRTFEDLYRPYIEANAGGFKDTKEYQDAQKYGITDYADYTVYKNSNFYGISPYKEFLIARKGKFEYRDEFLDAKELGIDNKEEYDSYKSSGYSNYTIYLKAKQGGFPDAIKFNNAVRLGLSTHEEYKKYIIDRAEEARNKIKDLAKASNNTFKAGNYAAYIAERFAIIELSCKLLYLRFFSIDLTEDKDKPLREIVSELEGYLSEKILDLKSLQQWNTLVTKINEESITLEKKKADEARDFFEKASNFLKKIFESPKK